MRPVVPLLYVRERIELLDGDFLDLDWSKVNSDKLLICVHGLEGHARKHYMAAMMRLFNTPPTISMNGSEKWDAVGINLRSCSGEDNRLLQGYHSGKTEDLALIIDKIIAEKIYKQIVVVGFSIGGNIALKYAGEKGLNIPKEISHVVALSVPCDLKASGLVFEERRNIVYLNQFLITLKQKARRKAVKFPNQFDLNAALKAKTFRAFDDAFTAPINDFKDSFDYWSKASSLHWLNKITVPTLLINALDDTFLTPSCFPYEIAHENPNFYLQTPKNGGHLGFMSPDTEGYLWTERRTWEFVNNKDF